MEDIMIFGKNRHFFGGIEPSSMVNFSAKPDENYYIVIEGTPPSDTVIDGQTLCTVDGVIIRKRNDKYPKDEFDGVIVADIKGTEPFKIVDYDGYSNESTYYYAAFPYSKQGVYNRSNTNRFVLNEPDPMLEFSLRVERDPEQPSIIINSRFPDNVYGGMIRKSTSGYPVDTDDGELVNIIDCDGETTDPNVEYGVTYYYTVFPYRNGVYFYNPENRASKQVTKHTYLFGYDLDTEDSNPDTRVSYPSDVDNSNFTQAKFELSTFNYGSWSFNAGEKFMPRPCVMYNGEVTEYLNPNNYNKNIDGATATRSSDGYNTMIEWPKIWTKRWEENGIYHFRCADGQVDDDYECWCNYDKNNNQIDHFYTSAYQTVSNSSASVSRSISGNYSSKLAYEYAPSFAKNNGDGFNLLTISDWFLIQDLLVMMAKTTACQEAYMFSQVASRGKTGLCDSKGLFGYDGGCGPKVFGMESLWSEGAHYVSGLFANRNGNYYLKITIGTKDGTTVSDYASDMNPTGYLAVTTGIKFASSTYDAGYISKCKTLSYGRLPQTVDGSSSTYECDYFNASNADAGNSDYAVACVGGEITSSSNMHETGPFYMEFRDSNQVGFYSFLSYKPTLQS